jgi:hypothetical protein
MDLLTINTTSIETIEQSFKNIANALFNDYVINVNDRFYKLLDIEFYYFSEEKFTDPYIHRNALQKETGRWYFHESGLDITFGADGNHGGILIRGIGKLSEDGKQLEDEVHGPVKVSKELTSNFRPAFDSSPNIFCLVKIEVDRASTPKLKVFKSNRVGLPSHLEDKDDFYKQKPYRFIGVIPENGKHKFKDKERVIKDALSHGELDKEIAIKILGYNTTF